MALLLASLAPARALGEDDPRSRALRLGAEGAAAYKAERFPEALARFNEAYRIFPATRLLLNISRTELKLGRCQEAIRAAERFQAGSADAGSPDAEDWLGDVRRLCIEVEIDSVPSGAAIWIDGERQTEPESTPWTGRLTVGNHKVLVWKSGYEQREETLEVTADAPAHLTLSLARSGASAVPAAAANTAVSGTLKIVTEPAGAQVSIDGEPVGRAPYRKQVEPGTYHLKVSLKGFSSIEKDITVQPGAEAYDLEKFATEPEAPRPVAVAPADATQTSDMIYVAGGTFSMGSEEGEEDEKPVTHVTLSGFWMDRTEVSVAEYRRCVDAGRCRAPDSKLLCNWGLSGRADHPINCVDWSQAKAFCSWKGKRLPTEAEWEYAARGKGRARYPWGEAQPSPKLAQWNGASGTAPIGSHPAGENPLGLRDLAGNVWEWVEDAYAPYPGGRVTNPVQETGQNRVNRGGSWSTFDPSWLRGSDRSQSDPGTRVDDLGFRCVRGT
jgi:formylglycine-generating enzyme required for sulfatase activity